MSDQEKLAEIKRIYDNAKPFGFRELEIVLPIMESLEDHQDRDSYICVCAEWLATHGDLTDLDRALSLIRSTDLLGAKCYALVVVASRFLREGHRQRALDILVEADAIVVELEGSDDYTEFEKALAWDRIADVYNEFGEILMSKRAWAKAVGLAQIGQYDSRQQEVHDNTYLLFTLVKKLAKNGCMDDAIATAQSIRMESWRQAALKELHRNK